MANHVRPSCVIRRPPEFKQHYPGVLTAVRFSSVITYHNPSGIQHGGADRVPASACRPPSITEPYIHGSAIAPARQVTSAIHVRRLRAPAYAQSTGDNQSETIIYLSVPAKSRHGGSMPLADCVNSLCTNTALHYRRNVT